MADVTPDLESWAEVGQDTWDGLLIGNGASMAVWEKFGYASLLDVAESGVIEHPLSEEEKRLFSELGTTNFEQVLWGLRQAQRVNAVFDNESSDIDDAYASVQSALVEAVHSVHLPHAEVPGPTLAHIRAALLGYDKVFSLNYDLIVYWAVMHEGATDEFKDFLWGGSFDIADTQIYGKNTKILWPHGGLHLYRNAAGTTSKRQAIGGTLLDLFGGNVAQIPLFVSEGSSEDKLRTISRSDYLTFAYQELSAHDFPLVIFGSSLDDSDAHIIRAVGRHPRSVAVAIRAGTDEQVVTRKASIRAKLPSMDLRYFDAATHPLGDPALRVIPPPDLDK